MKSLSKALLILALVTSCLAVGAAPADASIGLRYVRSAVKTLQPGDVRVSQKVHCPANTKAVGGGITGSVSARARIVSSGPFDNGDSGSQPNNGWRAIKTHTGVAPQTMQTFAICAAAGKYRYVREDVEVPDGTQTDATALCDDSTERIIGGGAHMTGADASIELGRSTPIDDIDGDTDRDDGWSASGNNESGASQVLQVWAICTTRTGFTYREVSSPMASMGTVDLSAECVIGEVVTAGGIDMTPGDLAAIYTVSAPMDNESDSGSLNDNGWTATAYNASVVPQVVTVTAVCFDL